MALQNLISKDGFVNDVNFVNYDFKTIMGYQKCKGFNCPLLIDKNNKIYRQPNSYLYEHEIRNCLHLWKDYELRYQIYERLDKAYEKYKQCSNSVIGIDDNFTYYMFCNAFNGKNIGHDVSIFLNFFEKYKMEGNYKLVFLKDILNTPGFYDLLVLYFGKDKLLLLENDKIYHFDSVYIFNQDWNNIHIKSKFIDSIISKAEDYKKDKHIGQKIILIKLRNNEIDVNSSTLAYYGENTFKRLKELGWTVIEPSKMSIIDIILYLQYASKIVTSEGAISYYHMLFMTTNSTNFLLYRKDIYDYYKGGYFYSDRLNVKY